MTVIHRAPSLDLSVAPIRLVVKLGVNLRGYCVRIDKEGRVRANANSGGGAGIMYSLGEPQGYMNFSSEVPLNFRRMSGSGLNLMAPQSIVSRHGSRKPHNYSHHNWIWSKSEKAWGAYCVSHRYTFWTAFHNSCGHRYIRGLFQNMSSLE